MKLNFRNIVIISFRTDGSGEECRPKADELSDQGLHYL